MEILKKLFFVAIILLSGCIIYGMEPGQSVQALVKTYMLPDDQEAANEEFIALLDNAKQQVLISTYWITDEFVVHKIIEVKKRGVDVQVIFDESTQTRNDLISNFLKNNIVPIVFPSQQPEADGSLMHNKFLVIDNQIVWTGSANFTKKAFDPNVTRFNHENVVIIESSNIADNFKQGFSEAKNDAETLYVRVIANKNQNDLPNFIAEISTRLLKEDPGFKDILQEEMRNLDQTQKNRVQSFFELQKKPFRPPTNNQRLFLNSRGLFKTGMSFDEASDLIGKIKEQGRMPYGQRQMPVRQQQRPASDFQKKIIRSHGINPSGMSYDEAYALIGQL